MVILLCRADRTTRDAARRAAEVLRAGRGARAGRPS